MVMLSSQTHINILTVHEAIAVIVLPIKASILRHASTVTRTTEISTCCT